MMNDYNFVPNPVVINHGATHAIEYCGYCAILEVDVENDVIVGTLLDMTFKGSTVREAKEAFAKCVEQIILR